MINQKVFFFGNTFSDFYSKAYGATGSAGGVSPEIDVILPGAPSGTNAGVPGTGTGGSGTGDTFASSAIEGAFSATGTPAEIDVMGLVGPPGAGENAGFSSCATGGSGGGPAGFGGIDRGFAATAGFSSRSLTIFRSSGFLPRMVLITFFILLTILSTNWRIADFSCSVAIAATGPLSILAAISLACLTAAFSSASLPLMRQLFLLDQDPFVLL